MLAKSKLNSIENLVSQSLTHVEKSHEKFDKKKRKKEEKKYEKMKKNVKSVSEK